MSQAERAELGFQDVPASTCPGCGLVGDRVLGNAAVAVRPGALSLCPACGFLSVLGDDLRVRELTAAEEAALSTETLLAIAGLRRFCERIRELL